MRDIAQTPQHPRIDVKLTRGRRAGKARGVCVDLTIMRVERSPLIHGTHPNPKHAPSFTSKNSRRRLIDKRHVLGTGPTSFQVDGIGKVKYLTCFTVQLTNQGKCLRKTSD